MINNPLFDASYERLFGSKVGAAEQSEPFFTTFYGHFLRHPDISELFLETDMKRQVSMLRRSFYYVAAFYVSTEPSAELERIGQLHHRLGIKPDLYDVWLDALVETVRELDSQCDLATELAWRWALTPGITYLKLFDRFVE